MQVSPCMPTHAEPAAGSLEGHADASIDPAAASS
jgi:hypothetical protein